jgi:PhnB protein
MARAREFYMWSTRPAGVDMLMRFKENSEPTNLELPPGSEVKIMHANLRIGDTVVMASATRLVDQRLRTVDQRDGQGHRLQVLQRLVGRRQGRYALGWSPYFGMLTDKFGVDWIIGIED